MFSWPAALLVVEKASFAGHCLICVYLHKSFENALSQTIKVASGVD